MFKARQNRDRIRNSGQFSVPEDLVIFPEQAVKIWDCPIKIGTDGHLVIVVEFFVTISVFVCQTIEESLGGATTLSAPQDQVEALIRQVAAENDLEITDKLVELQPGQATLTPGASARSEEHEKEDQLTRRSFVTLDFQ